MAPRVHGPPLKLQSDCPQSHSKFGGAAPGSQAPSPPRPGAPQAGCAGWTSSLGVCQRLELNEVDADLISRKASLGILGYNDNHHS